MLFNFTDDLITGNNMVDSQHKELIKIANNLINACNEGQGREKINETVNFLLSYVDKHFADEEILWMKGRCDNIEAHKAFHTDYKAKLKILADTIKKEGANIKTLGDVNIQITALVSHIRIMDKRMASQLK